MACRSLRIFALVLVVAACSKDDVRPTPKMYFQLEVDNTYETEFSDNWVFITDEKGQLWDIKPFERSQILVFDSTAVPEGKITITLMRFGKGAFEYDLDSYIGESVGEKWVIKNHSVPVETGSFVGDLSVNVSDPELGSSLNAEISNRYMTPGLATAENSSSYTFPVMSIYSNAPDLFIFVADKNGKPYYKFLEDAVAGNSAYSLNDFHAFDKEISISFPPSEYSLFLVKAFDEDQLFQADQGYIVNYYLEGLNTGQSFSNYQAGYLNRFTKYLTFLHAAYTGFDLSYEAYGGIPSATSIVVANPDLAITDKSFGNFTASSNDFQFRTSTWFARHSLNGARMATVWNVKSDNDHLKNPVTIPQILTDKYPNIIGGTFTHDLTIFNKGTKTFADVVAENFKGVAVKPYEQIRKAIQ